MKTSTERQVWASRTHIPAESQVPVVVSSRLGSLYTHRGLLVFRFPLPVGVFSRCFLGRAAGARGLLLRYFCATSSAGCYCFAWRLFVFGGRTTRLHRANNALWSGATQTEVKSDPTDIADIDIGLFWNTRSFLTSLIIYFFPDHVGIKTFL